MEREIVITSEQETTSETKQYPSVKLRASRAESRVQRPKRRGLILPFVLLIALIGVGIGLAAWKRNVFIHAAAVAAQQPEPMESITISIAKEREHRGNTTSIGTVTALRSISLRNEVAGTVKTVAFKAGEVVEAGAVLVALDVSVEEAELKASEAQAALAETLARRMERAIQTRATSEIEVDRAKAELDVAKAQIQRIKATIERKTIRAPFRARAGISDVHPGQYLGQGTLLTTLQGVASSVHVDFSVAQQVGEQLREGQAVEIILRPGQAAFPARIVAIDSKVDPLTRNSTLRALIENVENLPAPGSSVRVLVPIGEAAKAVSIPVSALRKGPAGDHVFVAVPDKAGKLRAQIKWVQAGSMLADEVVILSGLAAGEQVAASGSFKLREGVLLAVAQSSKPSGVN